MSTNETDKNDPRRRRCPSCGSPNVRKKKSDSMQAHPHRKPGNYYCDACCTGFDEPEIAEEPAERRPANIGIAASLEKMDPDELGGGRDEH